MIFKRKGSCNHCGKCCLPPIMLENPCIKRGSDRCDFYVDEVNTQLYGHCLIYGRGGKPIEQVKDRFGNKITKPQIDWFNENCIDYPSINDMVAGYIPPSGCGFALQVVVDG